MAIFAPSHGGQPSLSSKLPRSLAESLARLLSSPSSEVSTRIRITLIGADALPTGPHQHQWPTDQPSVSSRPDACWRSGCLTPGDTDSPLMEMKSWPSFSQIATLLFAVEEKMPLQ